MDFVAVESCLCFCFFKQKTAYEMRISDWSSDVCSSDLARVHDVVGIQRLLTLPHHRQGIAVLGPEEAHLAGADPVLAGAGERKSVVEGRSVSVRVGISGCRIIKTKSTRFKGICKQAY